MKEGAESENPFGVATTMQFVSSRQLEEERQDKIRRLKEEIKEKEAETARREYEEEQQKKIRKEQVLSVGPPCQQLELLSYSFLATVACSNPSEKVQPRRKLRGHRKIFRQRNLWERDPGREEE